MSRPYNDRLSDSFGLVPLLDALDRHLVRPVLAWRQNRVTHRELMALDDHQLADIGLSRGEIDRAAFTPGRVPSHRA